MAIVADLDRGRLSATADVLAAAGFEVARASSQESLAGLLEQHNPSIVVADHAFAGLPVTAPLLLLIDLEDESEAESVRTLGMADYIAKPAKPTELVHRADVLISRAAQRSEARESAERLREKLRKVSSAVRATHDPHVISDHLVKGFGETFGADRVLFSTFDDDRVPRIAAQWHRPGLAPIKDGLGIHESSAHRVADRLWSEAEVLAVDDHHIHEWAPEDQGLEAWTEHMRPWASAFVPVGEGKSSLGVIWIAQLDEPRVWTRTEISLIQHVAGNVAYGLIQSHLMSAQQQVVKQLRQLDQAKTDFLATVNHELRTPLTSISAYLDMIQDGVGGPVPPEVDRMLDIIVRNSERLRRLIEDMLTVSRQDYEGANLHLAPVQLGHTLQIVTVALRPLAELGDVSISLELDDGDPVIVADEVQLEQVFTNLVSNAIKFTPSGGRIVVSCRIDAMTDGEPGVNVHVRDTGVGIPAEEIPHLFTRFFRASNATSTAVPGSGLGLAIAYDIVKAHRGYLAVSSELGAGTTITVQLPISGP
ncbi:ATP-binding protein [Arthrobacter oryzae]|uniref:ATP-binding protein n=1 Tax=Arthrobacter oryzae TaxID=409290 RepID=UPI00285CFB24|nr:ATP-binding protein [Arthrobacter oryzae]MDR6504707.1 signal transduction histidine kinase/FixJ family two-component response regulator [Arthrobacter oryzae]